MEQSGERPFYTTYAWAYDFLITRPITQDCAGIATLLAQQGIAPGARLLDAGCGTGGYALALAQRGYDVTGLDLSVPLLREAQERAHHARVSCALVCGNLLRLPFAPHYDGVLCRGVLNDLLDTPSRQQVFCAFARVLRPGGVLLLDVRDWDTTVARKQQQPVSAQTVVTPRGTLTFRSVTTLDPRQHQLHVAERHTLTTADGDTVATYDFAMRCWTREELQQHLTHAGFRAIRYFGAYDPTAPVGVSDRLVSIASWMGEASSGSHGS
jgi:ubiquinone/menaquinone biosynthesis C-methylase UbiE